jgi:hypothetical protein
MNGKIINNEQIFMTSNSIMLNNCGLQGGIEDEIIQKEI